MIKKLVKPRKTNSKKQSYWAKKADKTLQEIGREIYGDSGGILGGEYSCLHHIYSKGSSTFLRYNWLNLVPISTKHHFKIHSHEPVDAKSLMDRIIEIKGQDWFDELTALKNQNPYFKGGYVFYREKYYELEKTLNLLRSNREKTIKELLEPYHIKA